MNIYIIALYLYSQMQAYVPYLPFSRVLTVKLDSLKNLFLYLLIHPSSLILIRVKFDGEWNAPWLPFN